MVGNIVKTEEINNLVNTIEYYQEATLPIDIHGQRIIALLDTGAGVNCISENLVQKLKGKIKIQKTDGEFYNASGKEMSVTGTTRIKFKAEQRCYNELFYIFKELSQHVILGRPFLYNNKVSLDFSSKYIHFNGKTTVNTIDSMKISPKQAALLSVQLNGKLELPNGLQGYITDTVLRSGLKVLPTASTVCQGRVFAAVYNTSENSITVPANTKVGDFRPLSREVLAEVERRDGQSDVQNDGKVQVERQSQHQPPVNRSPKVRNHEEKKAYMQSEYKFQVDKLEVDKTKQKALLDIVYKRRKAFVDSTGKLGFNDWVYHKINVAEGTRPICKQSYRVPPETQKQLTKQIEDLLQQGIIMEEASTWASPCFGIKKGTAKSRKHLKTKNNKPEYRFLVDYRYLNSHSTPTTAALCSIQDILDEIGAMKPKWFTSLDLKQGYFQMAIDPDSRKYTGFIFDRRSFVFLRTPMGLNSSPYHFQKLMNLVLKDLIATNKVKVYLDDIMILSSTWEEHIELIDKVLAALEKANLKLSASKCEFAQNSINYLGYHLTPEGITPSAKHVEALKTYPVPKTTAQLKTFLGLVAFFQNFIKNRGNLLAPLNKLTKKDTKYIWTDACQLAFEKIIDILTNKPVLAYADMSLPFTVVTDASNTAIGAVLLQPSGPAGEMRPVAYAGRACTPQEALWHTTDRESLAVVFAVKRWHYYLAGNHFTILTDHAPLKCLYNSNKALSPKLARHSAFLSTYDYDIQHIAGRKNQAADALSRRCYDQTNIDTSITHGNSISEIMEIKESNPLKRSPDTILNTTITITEQPLTNLPVECIINEARPNLRCDQGIAKYISKEAGNQIKRQCARALKIYGHVPAGQCHITSGGHLNAQNIIHAVVPYKTPENEEQANRTLHKTVYNALTEAENLGAKSVALPLLNADRRGFSVLDSASILFCAIQDYLRENTSSCLETLYVQADKSFHRSQATRQLSHRAQA